MAQRGRVLVIEEKPCAETQPLWDQVREQGYEVNLSPMAASAEAVSRGGRPDVVVLNMVAAALAGESARYLDAAARLALAQGARRLPVIALGDTGEAGAGGRPLGIAEVVPRPLSAARLAARIAGLRRLAVMQAEARRRIETAAAFGVEAPELTVPGPDADANVLVVGAGIRYLAVERSLARHAVIIGAFTAATALDYLARRSFDAIVVNMKPAAAVDFLATLRRDAAHFTLPAIALADEPEPAAVEALFEAGATDLVADRALETDLARVVRAAVAEHRFRQALRAVYARGRHLVTSDSLTGLYTRGFFMAHLQRCLDEAEATGEALTVAGFRLAALAEVNRGHGHAAGDHILRQVGLLAARLVRGEDLAARIGGARFALTMPATGAEEAEAPLKRLANVIRATRFALPGRPEAVAVDPAVTVTAAAPGDDAEAVLARLFPRR